MVGRTLTEAYLRTAEKVERGVVAFPKDFQPIWEQIGEGYEVIKKYGADYDMYVFCYHAAVEYDKSAKIGIDNAFSTVIDAIGVSHQSAAWYKAMAYHFSRQAERLECEE